MTPTARHWAPHLCLAAVLPTLLSGCDTPGRENGLPKASPLPTAEAATAAPVLLDGAGLVLPASAQDVRVGLVADDLFSEVSVTHFRAPRADAQRMCADRGDLVGDIDVMPTYEAELMGITTTPVTEGTPVPEGSQRCRFSFDPSGGAFVLLEPGDPAAVSVLLYTNPSR